MSNKIVLKKVVLENYRNFVYREFDFSDNMNHLVGKNGLGKTNIIEAIFWALNGQLFSGDSKNDKIGITPVNAEPGVKTKVSLFFEPEFTFEKISYEKFKSNGDFDGVETAYYINSGLIKQKNVAITALKRYLGVDEFDFKLSSTKAKDIDVFALLYNMAYLSMIDYQLLRALIIEMVGEVKYESIISENTEKYSRLIEPLRKHNNDLDALMSAKRTEKFGDKNKDGVETEISKVESLIKEHIKESEKAVNENDLNLAKKDIEKIDQEIDSLRIKKTQGKDDVLKGIELKISQTINEISKAKDVIRTAYEKDVEAHKDEKLTNELKEKEQNYQNVLSEKRDLEHLISTKVSEKNILINQMTSKKTEIKNIEGRKTELKNQYMEIKNGGSKEEITCPHCNMTFKMSETRTHKEHLQKQIDEINKKGLALKDQISGLEEGIETLERDVEDLDVEIISKRSGKDKLEIKLEKIQEEINKQKERIQEHSLKAPKLDFAFAPITTLEHRLKALESEKNTVLMDFSATQDEIDNQINQLKHKKIELNEIIEQETIRKYNLEKAKERKVELDKLKIQLVEIETIILLVKELQKDMFTKLNEKVENVFGENIQFRLFKVNVDGSIDTRVCDMLVKDIHGNFINIKNINKGMYPIRASEFISKVKTFYQIPKSFILIDEMIGLLDTRHQGMLSAYGEQIIGNGLQELDQIELIRK